MKNICITSLALAVSILVLISGCRKDKNDNSDANKNTFSYDTKEVAIGTAVADSYGITSPGVYGVTFYFLENTLNLAQQTGTGDVLSFTLLVNDPTSVPSGTFVFNKADGTVVNTLFGGDSYVMINFDQAISEPSGLLYISGGKVVLNKTGDVYEITFDLISANNTGISGYYKGEITNEDILGDINRFHQNQIQAAKPGN